MTTPTEEDVAKADALMRVPTMRVRDAMALAIAETREAERERCAKIALADEAHCRGRVEVMPVGSARVEMWLARADTAVKIAAAIRVPDKEPRT